MSRFNHKKAITVHELVFRVVGVLLCTALAVLFMPRSQSESYEVSVNHPWRYRELIAVSDFPVYKSDAQLRAELDSARKTFEPYFTLVSLRGQEQVLAFKNRTAGSDVQQSYRQQISDAIKKVYANGIVSAEEMDRYLKRSKTLRAVSGQESRQLLVKNIFTPLTAYEYIMEGAGGTKLPSSMMQSLDLQDYIMPNLTYDKAKSETSLRDILDNVPKSGGMVLAGTKVIGRGEIVTEEAALQIRSYMRSEENHRSDKVGLYTTIAGQALYVALLLALLLLYFDLFRRDYMQGPKTMILVATLVVSFPLITYSLVRHNVEVAYIVPYSMVPVFVRVFMDSRTAFMTHVTTVLLSAIALQEPFAFVVIEIVTGLVAIYSLRELSERSQIFQAALYVTLAAAGLRFSLDLMREPTLASIDRWDYLSVAIGGGVLICSYPLLYFVEKIFGFTSNVTLVELSNVNTPLLRRMTEVAPGTFQHSMQVANLAAEVAMTVGAKSQLVRTGALYHDIGKMKNPAFFTENQRGLNPHDQLTPVQSAQFILGHVKAGLELADQYRLPRVIKDFIATHHGCGRAKYFYIIAKNQGLDVDAASFAYPGPNPTTLEQAILMMSDAVEASSRSLKEYTDQAVSELVDRIVDGQVADGFFSQCPITFRDIADAKQVFKSKLRTIYHTRIEYPKEKK